MTSLFMPMNKPELTEEQKAYAAFVYILHQVYAKPYHNEELIQKVMDWIRRNHDTDQKETS